MAYLGGPPCPERVAAALSLLDQGIVPQGVELLWDYPSVSRRFPRVPLLRWLPNNVRAGRVGSVVRISREGMEAGIDALRFRTLRTIYRLQGREWRFVELDMVVLAELTEGTQAEDVLADVAALRGCNALEFGLEGVPELWLSGVLAGMEES